MTPVDSSRQALTAAFALFNDTSRFLAESYRELELRVADLTRRLAVADDARMRELRERERLADRLHALLETLPGGVIVLDAAGTVIEANPAARALLGTPLEGVAWGTVAARDFVAAGDPGELALADGRRASLATRTLPDGGAVLLLADVTGTRALQQQLDRQQRLLAMGEMSAQLAHELRTPLATALLYASRLAEGANGKSGQRHAGKVLERLRHLQQLLDSTLAFARGERNGGARLTAGALLDGALATLGPQVGAAIARTDGKLGSCMLQGQGELLSGALAHLLDNAMRAADGPHGVQVDLHLDGTQLEVHVRDCGPGVPAADAERVFEPFFTTRRGGTGLGLAAARAVARAHGGDVFLRSAAAPGATFVLALPLADAGMPLASGAAARAA